MNHFPWNEEIVKTRFWDPNVCNGNGEEFVKQGTLRSLLENPYQQKFEDILGNAAKAVVMLMNTVERLSEEKDALKQEVKNLKAKSYRED